MEIHGFHRGPLPAAAAPREVLERYEEWDEIAVGGTLSVLRRSANAKARTPPSNSRSRKRRPGRFSRWGLN